MIIIKPSASGYFTYTNTDDEEVTVEVENDLKQIDSDDDGERLEITADSKIVVTYTATLNSNAVIGADGNPNKVKITYSNNPNKGGNGEPSQDTTDSKEDINIVFTYAVDVDKLDGANLNTLPAAGFTLLKKYAALPEDVKAADVIAITDDTTYAEGSWYSEGEDPDLTYWKAVKVIAATNDGTNFKFERVDDGDYRLIESETPAGYNTMEPIDFTITATHDATQAADKDAPELTSLTVTGLTQGTATVANKDYVSGGTFKFTKTIDGTEKEHSMTETSGYIPTAIENNSGVQLPSTGGIGTTIFYVAGSVLVLAAAILLVTKRRMGAND